MIGDVEVARTVDRHVGTFGGEGIRVRLNKRGFLKSDFIYIDQRPCVKFKSKIYPKSKVSPNCHVPLPWGTKKRCFEIWRLNPDVKQELKTARIRPRASR